MEQIDYAQLLPKDPPEGLIPWLIKQGEFKHELLIYKADSYYNPLTDQRAQGVLLTCSACRQAGYTDKVKGPECAGYSMAPFGFSHPQNGFPTKSGDHVLCPYCGTEVTVEHVGNMRNSRSWDSFPITVTRIEDKLALLCWCVSKHIDKTGNTDFYVHPYEAYVVEQKKIIRLSGYIRYISVIKFFDNWEQRKKYYDAWGRVNLIYAWDSEILKGSTAEKSKLDVFMKLHNADLYPITYLRIWQKHPNAENLLMQGAGKILAELISDESRTYSYERPKGCPTLNKINWKEKRPAQMLGLNKDEFSICRRQMWNCADLDFYKRVKEEKLNVKLPYDMAECKNLGYYAIFKIQEDKLPIMPTVRYILRQRDKAKCSSIDYGYIKDYWRMAARNGFDINDKAVKWPKDLKAAHDRQSEIELFRMAEEQKAKEAKRAETLRPAFEKRLDELSLYEWQQGNLLIRPAASYEEFIAEGTILKHCVAGYAESHANGKTALFWIRQIDEPDKPYFTLELDEKKMVVKQNRGKHNCGKTPEVEAFEAAWLEHIRGGLGKPKTKKEAKIA